MTQRTCCVVFANGACCTRRASRITGWCKKCAEWGRNHGKDPQGRPYMRGNGELRAEVERAARATTDECIILDTPSGRRPFAGLGGVMMAAARAVWITANGDPGELHVLHTCHRGDEGCINIRHLYLGRHARNMRDMVEAGRQAIGEAHGIAKLTRSQVAEIRRRYVNGARYPHRSSARAIAEEYGIHPVYVRQLTRRDRWAWLQDAPIS